MTAIPTATLEPGTNHITVDDLLAKVSLSHSAEAVLREARSVRFASKVSDLVALAVPEGEVDEAGWYEVGYDTTDHGYQPEARVCRVRNGIAANYLEPYMRRRDPDCMLIGDEGETDKPKYIDRFGEPFEKVRQETFAWLKTQDLCVLFFNAGSGQRALPGLAICPANAGFFALGLAMLQGIVPLSEIMQQGEAYNHKAIVYIAPPFRHTHFDRKQVVIHHRREGLHELFSYNLYPGPSAKKGVYGMLLTLGERERFVTAHCSTVRVVTPYDNAVVFMHEGASGGGKSEMLEHIHREADGRLLIGTNTVTGEPRHLTLPRGCELHPVTDDMAICHFDRSTDSPHADAERRSFRGGSEASGTAPKKLTVSDAEDAWFLRVNHINKYGTDPHLERVTIDPPEPLLFLNIEAHPGATALIWQHIEDAPGKPCPNPRVVVPREVVPDIVDGKVRVDVRSFGVRCPPCTKEHPTYGIIGLFHVAAAGAGVALAVGRAAGARQPLHRRHRRDVLRGRRVLLALRHRPEG